MASPEIVAWIQREHFWDERCSLVVNSHGLLCFRTTQLNGRLMASPLCTGAPNSFCDRWVVGSRQTALLLEIHKSSGHELCPDRYYVAKEFSIMNEVLFLLKPSPSCSLVKLRKSTDQSRRVLEILSGISSWGFALSLVSEFLDRPYEVVKAIDNSDLAGNTYKQNHRSPLEIRDVGNKLAWPHESPFMVCGSPPCPLFSNLTGSEGFASDSVGTRAWYQMASLLRAVQPTRVLLENVPAIIKHMTDVEKLMYLTGFKLVHYRVVNVSAHAPFHRPRWISVWNGIANTMDFPLSVMHWIPRSKPTSLETFACIQDIGLDRTAQLFTPKQLEMMQDPAYKGNRQQMRPWDACRNLPSGKGSTITHMYGKSFDLDETKLRVYGLWCPYLDLGDRIRKFGEWEVARGHLLPTGLVLPESSEMGLGLLGNSVSPLQCGIGIILLELSLGNLTFQKSEEIVDCFRPRAQALKDMERCVESSWQRLVPRQTSDHASQTMSDPRKKLQDLPLELSTIPATFLEHSPDLRNREENGSCSSGIQSQNSARCYGEDRCEDLDDASSKDCDRSPIATDPGSTPKDPLFSAPPLDDEVVKALFQQMDESKKPQDVQEVNDIGVAQGGSIQTHGSDPSPRPLNPLDVARTFDLAAQVCQWTMRQNRFLIS